MHSSNSTRKLTGALIGCGAIAREHLAAVAALENAEITAVCDISAARAEATAERFGIARWYTNYQQLLADTRPNLVHITTSQTSHFPIASDCLSAGLNVLCEKPITVNYQQFRQLKQMALDHRCLLMENQNFRFHSGIRRILLLQSFGVLGEILDLQICLSLRILAAGSQYIDPNHTHASLSLRGGVIGDFLTHIAYLAYIFTGSILDLRTTWIKRTCSSQLPFDEFRGFIRGERATAYVTFSGHAQPDGFWVRIAGTHAHVETNLFEPPRLTMRRLREGGEPALMRLVDGIAEGRDVLKGSIVGFWRKLAGTSNYDGLAELIERTYKAVQKGEPPPVPLDEIDAVACLVDRFTATDLML
jgi:predicted dehydrogenase